MRSFSKQNQAGTVTFETLEKRVHLSTTTPKLGLYQAEYGGPLIGVPYFTRTWWAAPDMNNDVGIDPSQARITSLALIAKNGGRTPWNKYPVAPGETTYLDFEVDSHRDPLYYKKRLAWFHQAAPNVKVAIIGINFGLEGFNRSDVINAMNGTQPAKLAKIKAQLLAQASMIESMNVIPINAYMLGPKSVDLDLAYIKAYSSLLRQMFPTKGIVAWGWGAYHTTWNPPHSVFSDSVTQKYVQTIMSSCNSMVAWGTHADNSKLEQTAAQMNGYAPAPAAKTSTSSSSLFSNTTVTYGPQEMLPCGDFFA